MSFPPGANFAIPSQLNGLPVEVYLFARWSGYTHPVRPVDPLSPEEALGRTSFCRAYLEGLDAARRFVLFEAIGLDCAPTMMVAPAGSSAGFFSVSGTDGQLVVGHPLPSGLAAMATRFCRVADSGSMEVVTASVLYSYQYVYGQRGELTRALITNPIGTNIVEF
jgi:hypothetical protein